MRPLRFMKAATVRHPTPWPRPNAAGAASRRSRRSAGRWVGRAGSASGAAATRASRTVMPVSARDSGRARRTWWRVIATAISSPVTSARHSMTRCPSGRRASAVTAGRVPQQACVGQLLHGPHQSGPVEPRHHERVLVMMVEVAPVPAGDRTRSPMRLHGGPGHRGGVGPHRIRRPVSKRPLGVGVPAGRRRRAMGQHLAQEGMAPEECLAQIAGQRQVRREVRRCEQLMSPVAGHTADEAHMPSVRTHLHDRCSADPQRYR